jgi:hypothetical protein
MKSRDRGKKRAGKDSRPQKISDSELLAQVRAFGLQVRQECKELSEHSERLRKRASGENCSARSDSMTIKSFAPRLRMAACCCWRIRKTWRSISLSLSMRNVLSCGAEKVGVAPTKRLADVWRFLGPLG